MALYDVVAIDDTTAELKEIQIDTGSGSGGAAITLTANNLSGSTIAANAAVNIYYDGGSASLAMRLADITTGNSNYFHGFTSASVVNAASGTVQIAGPMAGFTALSQGVLYYLDPSTPGGITSTAPTSGEVWQAVGYSYDATHIMILPQFVSARQAQAGLIRTTEDSLIAFTNLAGISTGGDARGTKAVDWQLARTNTNQVAGGNYSVVAGGQDNYIISTADHAAIGGGQSHQVVKAYGAIAGGQSNTIEGDGDHAFIGGGHSNVARGIEDVIAGGSGNYTTTGQFNNTIGGGDNNHITTAYEATIGGGSGNAVNANGGTIPGGFNNIVDKPNGVAMGELARASRYNESAFGGGSFYTNFRASAQYSRLVLWGDTWDGASTTPTELFADHSSERLTINSDGRAFTYDFVAIAMDRNDPSRINSFRGSGNVYRTSTGNITLANDSVTSLPATTLGGWSLAVSADTTNQSLKFTATGEISKRINWVVRVDIVEVA